MDGLDDFMLFNACEDAREEQQRRSSHEEYPYQKQFWEEDRSESNYWDDGGDSSENEY